MSKRNWKKPFNAFLSAGLVTSLLLPVNSSPVTAASVAEDLIISEYIEGGSLNKAIELYNGTGSAIDLSDYTLETYFNGNEEPSALLELKEMGIISNGETFVINHSSANNDIKGKSDLENSVVINFSGNDPVVLRKSGEVVDSIGQVGSEEETMKDVTLVRKSNVTSGDKIIDDEFEPSIQWEKLPKDNSSNLGQHTMDESSSEQPGDPEPEDPETDVIDIADARKKSVGESVTVKGIVTAKLKSTISIQDETGGLSIFPSQSNVNVGDEITVTGSTNEYNGLLQISNPTSVENHGAGTVPQPLEVQGSEIAEELESQLVVVKNVTLSGGSNSNYDANDGNGDFIVRDESNNLGLADGKVYESITGIVQEFKGYYQIIPRSTDDIVEGNTGEEPGEPEEPVGEVISIAEARQLELNSTVTVKGTVAANLKNTISIQDNTGGIAVRPASLDATIGDEITVTGKIGEYNGLLQLNDAEIDEKTDGSIPEPLVVYGNEIGEGKESQLVVVHDVELTDVQNGNGWKNFSATDGQGEFIVRDERDELNLSTGNKYDSIIGIVQEFNDEYQIIPRSVTDVIADSSVIQPVEANPSSGTFVRNTTVSLSTNTADAQILYTLDGSDPVANGQVYNAEEPIEITADTTLKAVVKKSDEEIGEVETFEYKIVDELNIHDIQGAAHTSPMNGDAVEDIEGIVTASYTLSGTQYYHIQTPDDQIDNDPKTSEGIVLYSGNKSWDIEVGDLVSVTGTVSEYAIDGYSDRQETDLKTTQINVRDDRGGNVTVVQKDAGLPKPIIIDENNLPAEHIDSDYLEVFNPEIDAIDFWESLEGMLVEVGNVKAVAPQEHGDLITVLEDASTDTIHGGVLFEKDDQNANRVQFRLEPNGVARNFEVATGDRFNGPIQGVVGYSYQNFKIITDLEDMETAHEKGSTTPEKTTIVKENDKLTVASYNLENFSNNPSETSDDKAEKLARAFAIDMESPDIVGVTEVQDNNGQDTGDSAANESYERLIREIVQAGGVEYEYVNIDPANNQDGGAPNSNIRVGFLYNPERVSLTEGMEPGDAETAVGYVDGKLTHNPGRIDPTDSAFNESRKPLAAQFDFKGESVVVIANHWNSKSGDTPLFGAIQPPVYGSEEQRHRIAQIVYDFIGDIKEDNPNANVISLGDFNDYQFSETMKIHEGELMTNMINKVPADDRYTYLYQGNSQVLDHILVSNHLVYKTKVDILHINADFTDMAGRASDHDPVMIQVDLSEEAPEKNYNLKGFKTDKLTINSPSVSISLDETSEITEGIWLQGSFAELNGRGFKETKITIKPDKADAIIDFNGIEAGQVIIDGTNVKEIRGAENIIDNIQYVNGAEADAIEFTDSEGELIGSPSLPEEGEGEDQGDDQNEESSEVEEYYQSAFGKKDDDLKNALHEIISEQAVLSYSTVWQALRETDEDPNNPNNVILLYSGESRSKNQNGGDVGDWNREHVWAKSHGDFGTRSGPGTDIHHLRPTDVQVNSSRGNLDFDNNDGKSVTNCDECKRDSNSWEPPDRVKGDVARMLFYMAVRYEGGNYPDLELNEQLGNGSKPYHGKLSTLLEWHEQDPVDDFERNRNEVIYQDWQHNRNPFIDYPEWAEEIWGDAI